MGQAKDIVLGPSKSRTTPRTDFGVIGDLVEVLDCLDRAIELKQDDLGKEPRNVAENHHKLGLLKASTDLIRRAKAMLEDYGKELEGDTDPDFEGEDTVVDDEEEDEEEEED